MSFNKVFLVGFMGCGKSTFGRKLAKQLGWDFVDLDDYIEEQESSTISDIFSKYGEAYFRKLESEALKSSEGWGNTIVSTGGGTPCFNNNISLINKLGLSVYIKLAPEVLQARLEGEKNKRPLLADLDNEKLLEFITNKLLERSSDYEKSSIVFDYSDAEEPKFVESLKQRISK